MCNAEDVYYVDKEGGIYYLENLDEKIRFSILYLNDVNSGLLNLEHSGNDEYKEHLNGYFSLHVRVIMPDVYKLEYFDILLTDIETGNLIIEDGSILGHNMPVEKYLSVKDIVVSMKDKGSFEFEVLFKKEKIKDIKSALINVKYKFIRKGKMLEGEFKKEIYRKSKFKLG